jgi:uncharacterized protein YcfJ
VYSKIKKSYKPYRRGNQIKKSQSEGNFYSHIKEKCQSFYLKVAVY